MTAIQQFSKPYLRDIRERIDAAIQKLNAELKDEGVVLKTGNARYTLSNFTMKLEGALLSEDGTAVSREAENFTAMAKDYDLDPDWLGKTFECRGRTFRITGLVPRRPKMPVQAEDVETGKGFKFTANSIAMFMKVLKR